jgi:hypothetical protein
MDKYAFMSKKKEFYQCIFFQQRMNCPFFSFS